MINVCIRSEIPQLLNHVRREFYLVLECSQNGSINFPVRYSEFRQFHFLIGNFALERKTIQFLERQ